MIKYFLIIVLTGCLCAGWVLVQIIARKMNTKNHFDDLNNSCSYGGCNCGINSCSRLTQDS